MAEQGQARLAPSGSGIGNRARGQRRRVRRRMTYSQGREVIRNVPRAMQNLLRDERAIRREGEKKLKEFRELKMEPNDAIWEHIDLFEIKRYELGQFGYIIDEHVALSMLADSLIEPWSEVLTNVYHETFPKVPYYVYLNALENEWEKYMNM